MVPRHIFKGENMKNVTFPVVIKDGVDVITFTDADHGTYENGAACMSSLADMMVRVESGAATMATIITVNNVSFEHVSGKYWAHHNDGRFTLTKAEHDEMKAEIIRSGKYVIMKPYIMIRNVVDLAKLLETAI